MEKRSVKCLGTFSLVPTIGMTAAVFCAAAVAAAALVKVPALD